MRPHPQLQWWQLVAVAAVVGVVTAAGRLANANPLTIGFVFLLVVLFAATRGGLIPGLVASFLATACLNFFYLPPIGTFRIAEPENWIALGTFITVASLASRLVAHARQQAARAEERAREVETVARERERLLAERAHLEAVQQSEALKTALLRAVSHDLSTPLTAMGFQVGSLKRRLREHEALSAVEELDAELARLRRRIEDLLSLARLEAGNVVPHPEPVPAADLFRAARESLPLLRRRVEVRIDPECPEVFADPSLALEILVNLLENADRASPERVPIELAAISAQGSVRLGVLDRGRGIPDTPPGQTIDPGDIPPHGLGLEIATRFASASGGSVTLESRPGGGVAAWVSLPAVAGAGVER